MKKADIKKEKIRLKSLFGVNKELDKNPNIEKSITLFNGTFVPKVKGNISIFRGIPFALPPIKENRWKKPLAVEASNKIFEAYYNGYSPIQTVIDSERASFYPQSEDCLYLNMWINNDSQVKNKPIMVFIHGGSYGWGGTVDPLYDGYNFVKLHPDVILITIGYRVGLFGFIDLSSIEGGEKYPDAPNLGILDQIEALRFIKQNGSAFGGDINNITIFGESAGGSSVSLLPIIKEAKGLFHKVIAESGSVAFTYTKEDYQLLTKELVRLTNVHNMDELINLPISKLIEANEVLNNINNFPMRDGKLIPLNPYEAYKDVKDIIMLQGTNKNEINYWIGELGGLFAYSYGMPIKLKHDLKTLKEEDKERAKSFLTNYKGNEINRISEFYNEIMFRLPAIKQAEIVSNNIRNYMYYWKVNSKVPYFKACHAVELAYVFNNVNETIYTGKKVDEELAKKISSMWVNFAKTGNPSLDDLSWDEYNVDARATLIIDEKEIKMENDPLQNQRELLDPIVSYIINPGYGHLNLSLPYLEAMRSVLRAFHNSVALRFKK